MNTKYQEWARYHVYHWREYLKAAKRELAEREADGSPETTIAGLKYDIRVYGRKLRYWQKRVR